jgi:hypothetical protein
VARPPRAHLRLRRAVILCALLALPTVLLAPAMPPSRALLPADLLVQFQPWRAQVSPPPDAHFDALVWDGIAQYYPWRHFAAESLRAGVVPLWNPYQFCGTPFLANGQSAVLYPLNVLFWIMPTALAFVWSAWLHLALTGWFTYLLLRRLGAGRAGAVTGAVVWQGNSFMVAWIHLPTVLCTVAWLPLVLLLCERATPVHGRPSDSSTPRLLDSSLAGAALGLACLGGHPQMFLFVALLSAAYLLVRGLSRDAGGPVRARLARVAASGAAMGSVALGLAAVQLLPTLDFLRLAHRTFTPGPESYAFYLKRALQPAQLAGLVTPHPLGNPAAGTYIGPENYAEYALYIGLIPLGLALWAAIRCRTWPARFFAGIAALALLIALGTGVNWPLYRWLGFSRMGSPARILVLFVFAMSVLAGLGMDLLLRRPWPAPARRALPVLQVALIALIAVDLLLAARGHIHAVPRAWAYPEVTAEDRGASLRTPSGRVTSHLSPLTSQSRLLGNAADWPLRQFPNAVLPPNAATVYHLRDAFGYDSLYLAHYRDFAALVQDGDPSPPANGNMLLSRLGHVSDSSVEMMRLAGVGSVLSPVPVSGLALVRAGEWYTYRVPNPRPRAWVSGQVSYVSGQRGAIAALRALPKDSRTVLLVPTPRVPRGLSLAPAPAARVRDLSPDAVAVDLLSLAAGPPEGTGAFLLFLADAYAPGWHAYGDGMEWPVRPADVAFRSAEIDSRLQHVEFRYEPAAYRVGLFVTLIALAALGMVVGISVWRAGARVLPGTPAAERGGG